MEIRVLRYFLTVVREGSINRVAEVLHITQPTLSRQLSQLEEEAGVNLFHRGARKIMLTNEGVLLRRRAAVQILSEIIESFYKKYPLVSYDIFTANADLVKEQMEKRLVDIGVLLEPINMEKTSKIFR